MTDSPSTKKKETFYEESKRKHEEAEKTRKLVESLRSHVPVNNATPQQIAEDSNEKINYLSWKGIKHIYTTASTTVRKYGVIFVASYSALYLTMAGSYFLLLDNGIISTAALGFDQMETALKVSSLHRTLHQLLIII